jgi:hypothetical protein
MSLLVLSLLQEKLANDDPVQQLVCIPVKTAGLAIPDPVVNAQTHFRASEVKNSH